MRTIQQLIRDVNPIDPRHPDHPIHDEKWLALARAIGRAMADRDFDNETDRGTIDEERRSIRKVLKRSTKGPLH
jgi:hypothetical protein